MSLTAIALLATHVPVAAAWGIFLASYFVFAAGHLPGTRLDRPSMAVVGAVLMFLFRVISPPQAIASIDFATIVLLFSMMLIVAVLHLAGFFEWITAEVIDRLKPSHLLPGVIFTTGILSAFLVNDVVCLFLAPLVLRITRRMRLQPLPYLLAVATASNIGSSATITGNPQNILIGSISQIGYIDFLSRLGPVAAAGLFIDWAILRWMFRHELTADSTVTAPAEPMQAPPSRRILLPVVITICVLAAFFAGVLPAMSAAIGGALILLTTSHDPREIFAEIDWSLLVFFIGLFVIVGAAQQAGIANTLLGFTHRWNLHNFVAFTAVVTALSNIVSNVPAVMLVKNLIGQFPNPHTAWLLLAMASTLAGNLTITGSVANIIVIEKARPHVRITFWQYLRVGVPITLATLTAGVVWLLARR